MKKFLSFFMTALLIMIGGCKKYDDSPLREDITDLKNRVAYIEQWVESVNSNIAALQSILNSLQDSDYVTGVTVFTVPEPGGYIISFAKSGNVTIFNGEDGRDGQDGQDGESPQIAVKQDTDGVYYWTLNGEWIIADGNKLRVTGENGSDGTNPQIRINTNTGIWEVSYDNGTEWSSLGVAAAGANGTDGQNGITPQLRINSANIWEVSYDNGSTWISLNVSAAGDNGTDGQNGITPQLRISSSNIWEVSYDNGSTWSSLGVSAVAGINGTDGITPQMRINSSNIWEVSYDNGTTWTSLDVKATGDNGQNGNSGQDGAVPKIRINAGTYEWEISYDDGATWNTTGMRATGEKGDNGEAVFANNGVNNSDPDYIEFTLADGVTKIKVPKYRALGLDFTQPTAFAAGETKNIPYTAAGNAVVIKFVDIPNGWTVTVNKTDSKFTVTAPATFSSSNRGGEATILVSDNVQHTIIRTINFAANIGGGGDDGGDSDDSEAGDDATVITIGGYSGNTVTLYYSDNMYRNITKNLYGEFAVPKNNKIIHRIILEGGVTIIIGRKSDGSAIPLRLVDGYLALRDAAIYSHIPIGTYSEFQLINANSTNRAKTYKQEADIDFLNEEWTPIGFSGTFDGDNHTIANLKITGNNDYVGLFGYTSNANILNIHIISGSVSGNDYVGGICGYYSYYSSITHITHCSNASSVLGSGNNVGGVCGSSSSSITACYNTGSVSGSDNVGGVCGSSSSSITACYNTGSVSGGSNNVGGVCGSSSSSITACYNTGSISGGSNVGGVCGSITTSSITASYNTGSVSKTGNYVGGVCGSGSATACYWKDVSDDDAIYGTGSPAGNTGASIFSTTVWPTQWGTGDGSGSGKYWKSLGNWNNGNPIYPKLYFE
jgi:hypothetical protein